MKPNTKEKKKLLQSALLICIPMMLIGLLVVFIRTLEG
jgi:hypothetical protein